MNILFVNNGHGRMFDKLYSGASVRNTFFVKALASLGHVDVLSFYSEELKSSIENCNVININVTTKVPKTFRGKRWVDLLFRPYSPYTYFTLEPEKEKIVDEYFQNHSYDLVSCRYLSNAVQCGLLKYKDKLVIDLDDNPTDVYKILLSSITHLPFYKRWRVSLQGRAIGGMVKRVIRDIFCSFYSNPLEKITPNSVLLYNTTLLEKTAEDISDSTPYRLLMVGLLDYSPNKEGAKHFVDKVFPLIQAAVPIVELHIVGKCSDSSFVEALNSHDGVKAMGYVEDIMQEYKESRVIIIPIYKGSGTSVKFIEGLMVNRPVVSTIIGARGFENITRSGDNVFVAKDDEDFAKKTILLLNDVKKSKQVAHNGFVVAREHFSQEGFISTVKETITERFNQFNQNE